MDIEPVKIKPTWHKNRCGDGRVAKRLHRFLIFELMLDQQHYMRQWAGCGGRSDHLPIFLEYMNGPVKPPSPLKFNKTWLKDESFQELILSNWVPFNPENQLTATFQFAENISWIKGFIKRWAVDKRSLRRKFIPSWIWRGWGGLDQKSKDSLVRLQGRRNSILLDKEETWRLKSKDIWLECGDENTKFFHAFTRGRKASNTIWSLLYVQG